MSICAQDCRYLKSWAESTTLGIAITRALRWPQAVPRVGGLFPGVTTPLPASLHTVELRQACEASAAELLAQYHTLYVMWSGGADSTLVAACLLQQRTNQRIILTQTPQSQTDAPDAVLARLQAMGAEVEPLSVPRMKEIVQQGGMVVTGHHGDSILVGELVDYTSAGDVIFDIDPQSLIARHLDVPKAVAHRILGDLEPLLALMPFPRTAANIAWWIDFTCCWEQDEYDLVLRMGLERPTVGYRSFFRTEDFQRWSYRPAEEKAGRTQADHKYQYCDIIASILGFRAVFKKNGISPAMSVFEPGKYASMVAIDRNYNPIML